MRKLVPILAAVFAMALVAPALAGPAPMATGGVGWTGPNGLRHAGFNAHDSNPDTGQLELSEQDGSSLHVDVECVKVDGDTAWFGGEITKATGSFDPTDTREGQGLVTQVVDDGTPGRNGDMIGNRGAADADDACDQVENMGALNLRPVESGNLKVH